MVCPAGGDLAVEPSAKSPQKNNSIVNGVSSLIGVG
jgi:hypothetical protein